MNPFSNMTSCIDEAVSEGVVPGAVTAVISPHSTLSLHCSGLRSTVNSQRMTADTIFQIASMTKPITAMACMQAVERGLLELDQPAKEIIPWLGEVKVLDGFQNSQPIFTEPLKPVTLRNLLTHTSGFTYDIWNTGTSRWKEYSQTPATGSGKLASLHQPLAFEPGSKWEYGIGIDWAGQLLETVAKKSLGQWMRDEIFIPLEMNDTSYVCTSDMEERKAHTHILKDEVWSALVPTKPKSKPEFESGGGGLFSTVTDYAKFLQVILNDGCSNGVRFVSAQTLTRMVSNQMGSLQVSPTVSLNHNVSADFEFMPGVPKSWGLSFQINEEAVAGGRHGGSLSWAGLCNTHFWIDKESGIAALLMTQTLPFMIERVANLLEEFEKAVYKDLAN